MTETKDVSPHDSSTAQQVSAATALVAACLGVLSVVATISAAAWPAPQGWGAAPGLFPLMIASMLLVISAVLFAQSSRQTGLSDRPASRQHPATVSKTTGLLDILHRSGREMRAAALFAALGIYIFAFLPLMPFEIATTCFLLVVGTLLARRLPTARALGIMVIFPLLFAFVSAGLFDLPIVGNSSITEPLSDWIRRIVR